MDYEKKYKELVGQIKKAHLYAQTDSTKAVLEDILSELKESEDEKIRKYILSCCEETIKANDRGLELSMETTIKLRDWLEKQGKSNPYSGVSFEYNGHTWGMCARDNGVEILVDGEIKERVYLFDRPQGKSALETLKEEKVDNQNCVKPTDKVEPKFHEGDWVVDKEGHVFKIMRVDNCFNHIIYACRPIEENSRDWASYSENDIRLWDITEDAKAGDVLYCERGGTEFIVILKDISKIGYINSYCRYNSSCGFGVDIPNVMSISNKPKPATKEQRDTLFAKMREAGYEWDAEKLELKKVEQKPAEWSEDDEGICRAIINDIANDKSMCTFDISKGICDKKINWLKSLKERVACEANCTTTKEWSVCDEDMLNDVEESLEAYSTKLRSEKDFMLADTVKKEMEWIISLKDRVRVQPKPAWSEEDEEEANYIADFIENLLKKEKLVSKKTMTMENMIAWLRDIKYSYLPKPEQGWSEEDDAMIKETLYFLREYQQSNRCKDENGMQNSVTCENWLKSLKDRYTWKPSEEQIDALSNILKYFRTLNAEEETGETIDRLVDLHEQLKKLREE